MKGRIGPNKHSQLTGMAILPPDNETAMPVSLSRRRAREITSLRVFHVKSKVAYALKQFWRKQ